MPGLADLPNDLFHLSRIPAEGTAGSADVWTLWRCPFNATITGVNWIPDAAVTGAATNNFALAVTNLTQTLIICAAKTYASGTNSVANAPEALTLGVAATLVVTAADVIVFNRTVNGTGLASPTGLVEIKYRWR